MSRDGWGARAFTRVNPGEALPSIALLVSAFWCPSHSCSPGSFDQVIAITAFFFVAKYGLSYLAVFITCAGGSRTRRAPYRSWGYPWTVALAVAGSVAFLVGAFFSDERNSLWGIALLLASYPVYRLTKAYARQNPDQASGRCGGVNTNALAAVLENFPGGICTGNSRHSVARVRSRSAKIKSLHRRAIACPAKQRPHGE